MKRTVFFIIFLFLLNTLCLAAQAKSVGKFSKVEGRVDITSPGASARPVNTGDEVGVGDIIRVKSKSKAEIIFGDGGILRIAQKSRVKIDEYTMEGERKKGIFNLFRGKIENVLKKSGGFFGFKEKNKLEVHTPTAVCGVRGTDFFSTYQRGISNFVFKEGQGYGYNKNRPDHVMNINAGQAMLVIKPDVLPIVRMATAKEIAQHSADMAIKEEEDRDEEKKKDERVDEGSDDKKRDDKGKDKEPGDDEEKDQKPVGDEPDDQEPGDDKPRDHDPDDQEPGDYESGDEDQGDDKRGDRKEGDRRRKHYARVGDKPDDYRRGDDEPGDDGRGDYRRGDSGPRDGRRGDYGPDDYRPRDGRPGDHDPGDYGPRDGPPPGDYRAGDYGPEGPPRGDYGPGDYDDGPEGPPPPGDYMPWGAPPPGEYWGEGPPPPGDYGPEGPPPPGDYGQWGPPPPGEYWGEPGDFYAGDFGPGDYWGEPGDFYAGDFGPGDHWDGPDDYWGEPGDFMFDDFWGGPDDFWGMGPDIAFDIDDYLIPPFSVDSIGISGNSSTNKYDLSMSGKYNQTPPFVYMYENIRGALSGGLKSGYFYGFTTCGWDPYANEVKGTSMFFYIDSSNGSGGLMGGDVSGSYSTDLHDWNASGSLDWVQLGNPESITIPDGVNNITSYSRDIWFVSGTGSGNFYDAGSSDIGDFDIYKSDGIFDSIQEGQYWGFWENHIGGYHSTISGKTLEDCDNWFLEWEQKGIECDTTILNLHLYMSAKGTIPHYRNIEGDMAGGWVDIEHAVTGIAVGEFHGGYDPYGNDVFAGGGGLWLETTQLLTMADDVDGRADLAKLNIPNVTIGKATLNGSHTDGTNSINVTMTDVTFLANALGATPRIWATNNVSGTYAGAPSTDWTVSLSQISGDTTGVAAEFSLRTWDTSSNKWDATINNGSGTVGGTAITFKGGAGGNIDSSAAFSGTAAGWAH